MAARQSRIPISLPAQHSTTHTSVTRAFMALETIAASHRSLSLSELAELLDAPKSSLHSILHTLAARGYLEIDAERNYRLGVRTMEIGSAYLSQITPLNVAHPELVKLSHELHMTAHFAVLDGSEVLYLAKEDAPAIGIRLASSVGTRLPAHLTAVGKAILANVASYAVDLKHHCNRPGEHHRRRPRFDPSDLLVDKTEDGTPLGREAAGAATDRGSLRAGARPLPHRAAGNHRRRRGRSTRPGDLDREAVLLPAGRRHCRFRARAR